MMDLYCRLVKEKCSTSFLLLHFSWNYFDICDLRNCLLASYTLYLTEKCWLWLVMSGVNPWPAIVIRGKYSHPDCDWSMVTINHFHWLKPPAISKTLTRNSYIFWRTIPQCCSIPALNHPSKVSTNWSTKILKTLTHLILYTISFFRHKLSNKW